MSNELFPQFAEQTQSLLAPVVKTNKLAVSQLEKLVNFQLAALRSYADLGISQLKEAAEVDSPADLQALLNSQVKAAGALRQKLLDDAKALADMTAGFRAEFTELAQASASELGDKVAKTSKEVVAKAKEAVEKVSGASA